MLHILIEVDAAVRKLAERSLSLQLCITDVMSARYPIFQRPFVAYPQGFILVRLSWVAKERCGFRSKSWWCAHTSCLLWVLFRLSAVSLNNILMKLYERTYSWSAMAAVLVVDGGGDVLTLVAAEITSLEGGSGDFKNQSAMLGAARENF